MSKSVGAKAICHASLLNYRKVIDMELLIPRRPGFEVNSIVHALQPPWTERNQAIGYIKNNVLPEDFHSFAPALIGEHIENIKVSFRDEGIVIDFPESMLPDKFKPKQNTTA